MTYLGLNSRDALYGLQKSQDFPQALKLGTTRQAPLMFVTSELDQWLDLQKSKRPSVPKTFGSIHCESEVSDE